MTGVLAPVGLSVALTAWLLWEALLKALEAGWERAVDEYRRLTFSGRHTARSVRSRRAREWAAHEAALDRVWTTGIAQWAARAQGGALDRGRVAARAS